MNAASVYIMSSAERDTTTLRGLIGADSCGAEGVTQADSA